MVVDNDWCSQYKSRKPTLAEESANSLGQPTKVEKIRLGWWVGNTAEPMN